MSGPVEYHLDQFPPGRLDWSRLIPLLGPASACLARYDALLLAVPNATVLLSPLTTQEAVLSSRIEGTQATMGEVLEYEAGGDKDAFSPEKREDIEEILNYRSAMREPMFYLSEYLETNRQEYYDRLLAVSADGDWTGWCEFFLRAVERQATANETKAKAILALYEEKKRWIVCRGSKGLLRYSNLLVDGCLCTD